MVRELIGRVYTVVSVDLVRLSEPLRHFPRAPRPIVNDMGKAVVEEANGERSRHS